MAFQQYCEGAFRHTNRLSWEAHGVTWLALIFQTGACPCLAWWKVYCGTGTKFCRRDWRLVKPNTFWMGAPNPNLDCTALMLDFSVVKAKPLIPGGSPWEPPFFFNNLLVLPFLIHNVWVPPHAPLYAPQLARLVLRVRSYHHSWANAFGRLRWHHNS